MNRQLVFLPLLIGLTGCKGCQSENAITAQNVDTGEVFDNDWGKWLSMDTTLDGSPAIAYYDETAGAVGFAVANIREDGTVGWYREEVDGYINEDGFDSGDRGKYAAMQIAADGTVWIVYQDVALHTLRYAMRDLEGNWTSDVADIGGGSSPDAGYFASLALDGEGNPVAVHYDQGKGNLRIARWIGGSFTGEVLAEGEDYTPTDTGAETVEANVGEFAKILITGGIEYVAYYDRAAGDLKLSWGTAGAHSIETIDTDGDVGQWPDLLIDSGTIHIAYHDVTNQDLRYAWGEPGGWSTTVVDDDEYVGADTDIFLKDGAPAIAYFDGRNNNMKMAWQSGGEWMTDTVVGADGALGFFNEVVVNDAGESFAACYNYTDHTLWFSALD